MSFLGVTFSGVDESVPISRLREIRSLYFNVEWGICLSIERQGMQPRFPSLDWMRRLDSELTFAALLCGRNATNFLRGDDAELLEQYGEIWPLFRRIQVNLDSQAEPINLPKIIELMEKHAKKRITFHIRDRNLEVADAVVSKGVPCSILFDQSGTPETGQKKWPKGIKRFLACGYTGGLGPDNIYKQLSFLLSAAQTARQWWVDVDACAKVTENGNEAFSLESCRRVIREFDAYFLDYTI